MVKHEVTTESKTMSKLEQFWDALGNKSESTKSGYKTAIWQFILFIYADATKDRCEQFVEQYLSETRDNFADFKKFIQTNLANKPGLSALQNFNQIKNFLALSDISFNPKQISLLKNQLPSGGVETQEADLDTDTIKAILQHCDIKTKAIVLMLASGGMRIGELLSVRCVDVDFKTVPTVIQIRAKNISGKKTKTGMQRYTFISTEATAAVKEWIKVRPNYLKAAAKMGKNFKTKNATVNVEDERLFPVSDNSVNDAFKEAIAAVFGKNEVDPTTGRSVRHIHQLRKFFISQISLVTSESVADYFAGHKTALSDNYRRYTTKQMSEYYLKGEHMLYIEATAELREAASTTKKEIAAMKDDTLKNHSVLLSLMNEKDSLKEKISAQSGQIAAQDAKINAMLTQMDQFRSMLHPVLSRSAEQEETDH